MLIVVEVMSEGAERPPAESPVLVQVIDATYADAPGRLVAEATGRVLSDGGGTLYTVEIEAELQGSNDYRVRAHVDVDGDGAVSPGDFVSMAAFPAREHEPVRVVVRKV